MDHKINDLLLKAAEALANYLECILPSILDNWWKDGVIDKLSFHQQRWVEQKGTVSLSSLDLAALLRVLDQNWYQISMKRNLSPETRHFVKEMQTIRNRWAHAGTEGFPFDDLYRDLDTLQRFAMLIEGEEAFIQEICAAKTSLLERRLTSESKVPVNEGQPNPAKRTVESEFEAGQVVFLRSNPEIKGAVVSTMQGKPENRYEVFIDGRRRIYYASQIQTEEIEDKDLILFSCRKFHAYLTALQIQHPGLSTLYSLNAARIDFIPYQFRPVLKFIRSDRPRLLIADGVGVGKTIEAGLILRELQARHDVRSVLIICPKPLITERKWELEMRRFDERFVPLNGKALRYCIKESNVDGEWPDQYAKSIIPYSLFDQTMLYGKKNCEGLLHLDPAPHFDMVIVDETHHIKNKSTFSHKGVRFFCDNADAVLFLTATPIQLGSHDLFVQLNMLRPDIVVDEQSFTHMAKPNPSINRAIDAVRAAGNGWQDEAVAELTEAANTSWGKSVLRRDPEFTRIQHLLGSPLLPPEKRVPLVRDLEEMLTFSGIISRTRRRDIADFTVRKPMTVEVPFTPQQQKLHDDLLYVQEQILASLHENISIKFMMTTIRRQAASCLFGLAPMLKDILMRRMDELECDEVDAMFKLPDPDAIDRIKTQIMEVLEQAEHLDPVDPKREALQKIIREKQQADNKRVILFSSFRHTLRYLFEHLKAEGIRVGMVHGDTPDEERVSLRRQFQLPHKKQDALDVLLFSEVGCEGLDYQFCDCMVNYDLPWNPMRVEQRIGRIDRNGQKSESVLIYNMITPGTVDAEIYKRCLLRIGVFNSALGTSEEILGDITREINAIAVDNSLTDEQRTEKLRQISDNKIGLIEEQQRLEDKQADFFGLRLPYEQTQRDIDSATSYWLTPQALENMVALYLQKVTDSEHEHLLGEKPLKTLRLAQDARNMLLQDFHALNTKGGKSHKAWVDWLKGKAPTLTLTFDPACASEHPNVAFINPLHPLIRQAAKSIERREKIFTALKVWDSSIPVGNYPFVIYQWQFQGVREDLALYPVCESAGLREKMLELLPRGRSLKIAKEEMPAQSVFDALDTQHHALWAKAIAEHQKRTRQLAVHRRESLTVSYDARVAMFLEQLEQEATDDKIRRMRQSQLDSAKADYERRSQELEQAINQADISAQAVAYGVIQVKKGNVDE